MWLLSTTRSDEMRTDRGYNCGMNIITASGDRRIPALRLLFARFPAEEQEGRVRDALAANERGTLHFDHLLLAESDGLPVGSALAMLQSDGVALVWPPVVSCGATNPVVVEDLLMSEICSRIDAASARLGQCLLAPDDDIEAATLGRHGFERATDMFFMARGIAPEDLTDIDRSNEKIRCEKFTPETTARFVQLIEQTYQGSLDCAYLNGIRTGDEAIVSHKLSGEFHPDCWSLYTVEGQDAGVAMLNDHPDQDAVELVYIGVAPHARGQGLGRRMLQDGIRDAVGRGRAVMFLAVDCENRFANALYGEFQFAELARRQVMLRHPFGLAR
ncbi:MAG: acetyltransferase [Schlesneria sp.]|nr:acetyltransferase [Schlesneria sp.]